MKTRRMMAALVVALLSVTAVMAKDIRTAVFKVSQMHCENCERKVKNNIKFEKGVKEFSTDLKTKTVSITYDAEKTNVDKLKAGFKKFNYEVEFVKETKQEDKKYILEGIERILTQKHIEKIWEMVWKRWCHFEEICSEEKRPE